MLKSEIIYNIRNLIAGGITSDDTKLSNEQWSFIIDYYRAKLFKQEVDRGKTIITLYDQPLGLVDLIQTDRNECCLLPFKGSCILRTRLKIPTPLQTGNDLNITHVGLVNGTPIMHDKINAIQWSLSNKYTGKEPKWYYYNGYIYLVNPPSDMIDTIVIRGVFQDPSDAVKFKTCDCTSNGLDCSAFSPFNIEYPMPMAMVDTIVKLIVQTEVNILKSMSNELTNDSRDDGSDRGL